MKFLTFVLTLSALGTVSCKNGTSGEGVSEPQSSGSGIRRVLFKSQEIRGEIRALNGLQIQISDAFLECFFSDGSGSVEKRPQEKLKFELKNKSTPVAGKDNLYQISLSAGKLEARSVLSQLVDCKYVVHLQKKGVDSVGADIDLLKLPASQVIANPDVTERVSAKLKSLSIKEINGVIIEDGSK